MSTINITLPNKFNTHSFPEGCLLTLRMFIINTRLKLMVLLLKFHDHYTRVNMKGKTARTSKISLY